MNKKYCRGCHADFYNHRDNINGHGCWSFKDAKVVWRIPVGYWENPPYRNKKKVHVASCYHENGSNRILYVDPEKIDSTGYMC